MKVLSLDTAAKTASVCVCSFDGSSFAVLSLARINNTLTHSESLLPMIDFCIKSAGLSFSDIDAGVISAGPGSFTGVRIGISTLKGLAFGKDFPCVPVSTLSSLAENVSSCKEGSVIFPLMDARRDQFYNAVFEEVSGIGKKRLCADRAESFEFLSNELEEKYKGKDIFLVGDGAKLFYTLCEKSGKNLKNLILCPEAILYEDAFSSALAAKDVFISGNFENYTAEKLQPVYLRVSQAERERAQKESN
ncbi:MAG: tRNA (adenosine(37)-N6)-threonylcarbamoyltransferase complex dimerization subunit type 1 TsaB [Clostridiales bacterium]|nr:tRNA (adenosine(37)-N6)-threonylcarbamoyltransferase complex dimerization subunit type 1 TsaB [Clostridiales bacterium]